MGGDDAAEIKGRKMDAKAKAKKARMMKKLKEMLADGWTEQGALELLVAHGYGELIGCEAESGYLFLVED